MDDVVPIFLPGGSGGSERVVGQVADYCHTCGVVRPFLVGATVNCMECGDQIVPGREGYKRMVAGEPLDLETLITITNPGLPDKLAGRLTQEKKFREKQELTAAERWTLLQLPFVELSGKVAKSLVEMENRGRKWAGGWFGYFLLMAVAVGVVPDSYSWIPVGFVIAGLLGAGFTIWFVIKDRVRKVRNDREILASLAQRLQPLSPTQQELEGTLTNLRKEGHEEIAKLKPQKIMEAISEGQAAGPRVKGS